MWSLKNDWDSDKLHLYLKLPKEISFEVLVTGALGYIGRAPSARTAGRQPRRWSTKFLCRA